MKLAYSIKSALYKCHDSKSANVDEDNDEPASFSDSSNDTWNRADHEEFSNLAIVSSP